jgi:hypothetical protein
MNTGFPGDATAISLPRAGFWRRGFSFIIDSILVLIPFQLLAAVLFAATAGMIQMNAGFFHICENGKYTPRPLDPPPPHDSNAMRVCKTSFFGATTGASLTVGCVTREGSTTTTVSQSYLLDKEGTQVKATSLDWIFNLALLAYLIVMIWKTGRTYGARAVKVRVVDVANPEAIGLPLGKTVGRFIAMLIGPGPMLVMLIYQYVAEHGNADAMFSAGFFRWFIVAAVFGFAWGLVLVVQIVKKTDPVYDRLAGTAVLVIRTPPPIPA